MAFDLGPDHEAVERPVPMKKRILRAILWGAAVAGAILYWAPDDRAIRLLPLAVAAVAFLWSGYDVVPRSKPSTGPRLPSRPPVPESGGQEGPGAFVRVMIIASFLGGLLAIAMSRDPRVVVLVLLIWLGTGAMFVRR